MRPRPEPALAFVRAVAAVAVFAASAAVASAQPCQFWVAPPPAGNDANPGTLAQPWATLQHAVNAIPDAGCTVWAKDGLYNGRQRMNRRFAIPATFRAVNPYRAIFQASETVISIFGGRNIVIEGLEIRHAGSGASPLVIQVQQDVEWAEDIVFRNNVLHDSWDNDILKVNNGARRVTVEGNLFYNQTGSDEHIDVNSVTDVVIQDNVFFNDFAGSGRPNLNDTSSFIVIKDSNAGDDGQIGSERITVRRNVFLNWQGSGGANFVLTGEDGQPFPEAVDVLVENNLMIGNSGNEMRAPFGVKGCRNVNVRNNTVVGDLPSCAYGLRLNQEGSNPVNDNITFYNNIWSDPTGTMGTGCAGGNDFSDGLPSETTGEVLDRNLYWNGGAAIPPGDVLSPLVDDVNRIVGNPLLNTNQSGVVLPRWTGTAFLSGNATIRQEFERLVSAYGAIPLNSPAVGQANPARAPADDILGRPRGTPDLGAFQATPPAELSISDVLVTEGQSGTTAASFTLTLSPASSLTVTVQYATANGTATAGSDYTAASGTVTFPPGVVTRPLSVTVRGDVLVEADEFFFVDVANPTGGAVVVDSRGQGTIVNDDGRRSLCRPIASVPYTIPAQGNYCLAQNLSTAITAGNAITIDSDFVNLDMKSFKIGGGAAGPGTQANGIYALNRKNVTVKNVNVRGFFRGVFLEDDSGTLSASQGHVIQNVRADENTYAGIHVQGRGTVVRNNQVVTTGGSTAFGANADAYGIRTEGSGVRVLNNDVTDTNPIGTGSGIAIAVEAASASVVEKNRLANSTAGSSYGVRAVSGDDVLVIGNRVSGTSFGVYFDSATGTYRDNLTTGVTTPYTGGTNAGNNQ